MMATRRLMMLGKCYAPKLKQVVTVSVPHEVYDDFLHAYFTHTTEYEVYDPEGKCKRGDIVLIKEMNEPLSIRIKHQVDKIIYEAGNVIDPLSGRRCFGNRYTDEIDRTTQALGYQKSFRKFLVMKTKPKEEIPSNSDV
ncbi:28S ribosomal protein S17, mitochondrial-like [Centruroides sculpturatus]|uniref:28S ribosomal protein S17, mitochondrial-like n=1 Tax=Centruroides sculpturatus TaxID=218467 RepID=UPI000C6CDB8F|nr:28S ribosomal protein S17, mitochondrial-like [Centruroides sculpturatus]